VTKRKRRITKKTELDIVIPVYGQVELLEKTYEAAVCASKTIKTRFIIVDDFSPKNEKLEKFYKKYENVISNVLIRNKTNMGFPVTANIGVAKGVAPYCLILNSDVVLAEDAIEVLLETLKTNTIEDSPFSPSESKELGVVAPKLVFPLESTQTHKPAGKIQHAGLSFGLNRFPKHRFVGWDTNNPKANIRRELQAVSGACLLIKREVWTKVTNSHRKIKDPSGGFNHVYGRGTFEDVEFCLAVRAHGYKIGYIPEAWGIHYTNSSVEKGNGFPINRNFNIFKARCGHLIGYDDWFVW